MAEEGTTGLIWERRLALWLPRPIFFGAFLIAASLSAAYLFFQWFFDLGVDRLAILFTLMIAFIVMVVRYTALGSALDRQRYGLDTALSDRRETEVRALQLPRDKIRRSRLAGAMGILASVAMLEGIFVINGDPLVTLWI